MRGPALPQEGHQGSRHVHPRLEADEIHAWLVDLDAPVAAEALAWLDSAEHDRTASYLRPRDGARFAASRAALRAILARYLAISPASVRFRHAGGPPALAGTGPQFSLSRSGARALIAVADRPVGADLEAVVPRPGLADLVAGRFTRREAACLQAARWLEEFYRHWTAKEAYGKARGNGLVSLPRTELACGPDPAIWVRGEPAADWTFCAVDAGPGYAAAVVARAPACVVTVQDRPAGGSGTAGWM